MYWLSSGWMQYTSLHAAKIYTRTYYFWFLDSLRDNSATCSWPLLMPRTCWPLGCVADFFRLQIYIYLINVIIDFFRDHVDRGDLQIRGDMERSLAVESCSIFRRRRRSRTHSAISPPEAASMPRSLRHSETELFTGETCCERDKPRGTSGKGTPVLRARKFLSRCGKKVIDWPDPTRHVQAGETDGLALVRERLLWWDPSSRMNGGTASLIGQNKTESKSPFRFLSFDKLKNGRINPHSLPLRLTKHDQS